MNNAGGIIGNVLLEGEQETHVLVEKELEWIPHRLCNYFVFGVHSLGDQGNTTT